MSGGPIASLRRCSVALALAALSPAAGAVAAERVEQPRAFAHFIGDRLQQRVLLELQGVPVRPAELPAPGRLSAWFERLVARTEDDAGGRTWLVVDYQITNSALAPSSAGIPAWRIKGARPGGGEIVIDVPAWRVDVAPLGTTNTVSLDSLRPDRAPMPPDTAAMAVRLRIALVVLLLDLLAWLGWVAWRRHRLAARLPFAQASRQVRALPANDPAAWHVLHRAFERSAGRAVQPSSLPVLFRAAPHLDAARAEIADFYTRSQQRFFAPASGSGSFDLAAFSRRLKRLEKRRA
jgi:mxaA protein